MADVNTENYGTIVLLYPQTNAAWDWLDEYIEGKPLRFGPALAVDHRMAADLTEGMKASGLEVE